MRAPLPRVAPRQRVALRKRHGSVPHFVWRFKVLGFKFWAASRSAFFRPASASRSTDSTHSRRIALQRLEQVARASEIDIQGKAAAAFRLLRSIEGLAGKSSNESRFFRGSCHVTLLQVNDFSAALMRVAYSLVCCVGAQK